MSSENHYETSAKTLEEFKKTLETFKKTLKSNRVGEKLNVELKDQYGFEDVMDIATRLKESHEGDGSVSSCMTKIKAAFRYIGKRKGVLANLARFAPNDSYGVVLCGGFTVILGVSLSSSPRALFRIEIINDATSRQLTEQTLSERSCMQLLLKYRRRWRTSMTC